MRHYIPVLARKSRCFSRSLETLKAVVAVFVDAYNRFGLAKFKSRQKRKKGELPFSFVDFSTPPLATPSKIRMLTTIKIYDIM